MGSGDVTLRSFAARAVRMHEEHSTGGRGSRSLMATLAGTASFENMGASLERIRRELWLLGDEMTRHLEPTEGTTVTQALRTLQGQVCRIAIIGQVKAGKSTFISAMIGRPNLLPSDVNPWTTVVTSLHYTPAEQVSERAEFTFFGPDEWNRIAVGGGILRELTERLVPGFNTELLRLQLENMRRRAELRLGPQFYTLLGHRHEYDLVTRELLERYVTAGNEHSQLGASGDPEAGRYSDLTKSADLYFAGPRTGFPMTMVDTPGTNDPLLVRDEITRLSLASADVYIVVLTAQQPLSATDVALLRILRGLHKDRLIVFINRVDQLRNPAVDCHRLVAHVRDRLRHEFPETDIPIIAGSAWWGSCALSNSPDDIKRAANEAFTAYAERLWRDNSVSLGQGASLPGSGIIGDVRENLKLCSGIPSVLRAVDHLMLRGKDAHVIQQMASFLLELTRSEEIAAQADLRANERLSIQQSATASSPNDNLRQWQQEFDQLNAAALQIEEVINVFRATLDRTVNQGIIDLQTNLLACITRFADFQIERLTEAYHEQSQRVWMADASPLREDFERAYLSAVRHSSGRLRHVESIVRDHMANLLKEGVLEGMIDVGPAHALAPSPAPNLAPLSAILTLDLDQPWWKAWLLQRPTLESRRAEFKRLIDTECASMAGELVAMATNGLQQQSASMAQQITAVTLDVVNSMRRRSMALVPGLQHEALPTTVALEQPPTDRTYDVESARGRLAAWERLRGRLASLSARCDRLIKDYAAPLAK
jgi:signal recognition particle receptor subunit beta